MLLVLFGQTGVDAGPAAVTCDGGVVTLIASPINPPANYRIRWDDRLDEGIYLIDNPSQTTSYRVTLTNLDTQEVFEDSTRILVPPDGADLFPDGLHNGDDWLVFFDNWDAESPLLGADADGDGLVSVLDFFYICNHDVSPPNTPPSLSVSDAVTYQNESIVIPYQIADAEQQPFLVIRQPPTNGSSFILSGQLWYVPGDDFLGTDAVGISVSDGYITSPIELVDIEVREPDHWDDLYNDIFFVHCKACHIDAVSGNLSLNTYALAQMGGVNGAAFIPFDPQASPMYLRVADNSMPLGFPPLSDQEKERIRLWILRGAIE